MKISTPNFGKHSFSSPSKSSIKNSPLKSIGTLLKKTTKNNNKQLIVQQISEKIWKNCAVNDTSMKFCIEVGGTIRKIFGYRDIADSSGDNYGGYFQIWHQSPLLECCIKGLFDHGRQLLTRHMNRTTRQ